MNKTLIVAIVLAVLGCVLLGGGYVYINGLRNQGLAYETPLSAQYQACQLQYSAYTAGFKEQFGVYQTNLKGLDVFVSDAVKGRYDTKDAQGNPTGTIDAGIFIKAVAEAYPDFANISALAGKLMDYAQAQREAFKNCQTKIVDMDQQFRLWRRSGLVQSQVIRLLGFPDDTLVAQIGVNKWYGQQAEDKMMELVLTSDAIEAYMGGTDKPLITPAP